MMYSLLIVDDERWVRQGLVTTIDWEAEGIKVIGDVEDGEDALTFIQNQMPDIIITDIKMPRMDGLAFIEAVKNANMLSKIIIISGYSEFSYAQKAMRLGAVDYVLKPIEETLMLEVVRKCIEQIKREREDHNEFVQMSERVRESLPLARQRYVETLLTNGSASQQFSRTVWDRLNIPLDPDQIKVTMIKIYDWGVHEHNPKEHYLLRHAIGNLAKETGKHAMKMIACPLHDDPDTDLAILVSPNKEADLAHEQGIWETLISACWRYLGIGINIGISKNSQIADIHASFQEAVQISAYAFYEGYGKVYDADEMDVPQSHSLPKYTQPNGWVTRFVHAVKLSDDAALRALIDELFGHLQLHKQKCSPHVLRKGLTSLFTEVEMKLEINYASDLKEATKSFVLPYFALSDLKDVLLTILLQFQPGDNASGNRKRFIELAVDYMEKHYTEPLTMNRVAEHLFLNPSYFSKIFHEKTGETFSKYLIRLRVNRAKELLKVSTLKIYEVAEQVGYQDFRHFVKLFKEQEGMTPAQYRDIGV
ncbi:response regulator [Paenibacillus anseongensis]|uniref:Response regulator n=2 Tax=Paenibacillus anseongense TaxID=2682845 RepID=A0ABW9UJ20_9BACL|nr:response regulator [Paenibacillus sp. CGMCC 1.16610]MVQ40182.1 response regulator [Paenibacillus anseongense]